MVLKTSWISHCICFNDTPTSCDFCLQKIAMADFHFCVCVPAVLPNLHIPWIQGASQTLQCYPAASHPKSKLLLDSEIYGLEESKGGDFLTVKMWNKTEKKKCTH